LREDFAREVTDMMQLLRKLFAYDEWANVEVMRSLRDTPQPPERCLKLMAHILSAERLWLERVRGQKPSLAVWPNFGLEEMEVQRADIASLWKRYLAAMDQAELARVVLYTNSKGEPWNSRVQDILSHVAMHSAYHRGQIASELRASGHQPAYTDFIHGVRQGLIE
jgi:uncharacterized damage-inducible protein DinB